MHSGGNGGKRWRIKVFEKYGPQEVMIWDSKKQIEEKYGRKNPDYFGGTRPINCVRMFVDWLFDKTSIDFEALANHVNANYFSIRGFGRSLRKMGRFLNDPLGEDDELTKKKKEVK